MPTHVALAAVLVAVLLAGGVFAAMLASGRTDRTWLTTLRSIVGVGPRPSVALSSKDSTSDSRAGSGSGSGETLGADAIEGTGQAPVLVEAEQEVHIADLLAEGEPESGYVMLPQEVEAKLEARVEELVDQLGQRYRQRGERARTEH